jgi:hypothetical protein
MKLKRRITATDYVYNEWKAEKRTAKIKQRNQVPLGVLNIEKVRIILKVKEAGEGAVPCRCHESSAGSIP